jgi:hypothetical protein
MMRHLVTKLKPRYRELVELRYFEELHILKGCDLRIMGGVGIEKTAEWCFKAAAAYIKKTHSDRCWVAKVEVWEHAENSATYQEDQIFYGADKLRIGIRCRKIHADDGCLLFNQYQQVSKLAVAVGLKLIENFETDHTQIKFREKQLEVCKELNIEPSNCITFGLATKDHPEFGSNDRGSEWRRVCISKQLSNCYNDEN